MWPGYGENSRVLEWIVRRLDGEAEAVETPIGLVPASGELNVDGLDISEEQLADLFAIHPNTWLAEADLTEEYYLQFGDRVPEALNLQLAGLRDRLGQA